MEKSLIIKEFLKKGIQVDSRALDALVDRPERIESILQTDSSKLPAVISKDFIEHDMKIGVDVLQKVAEHRFSFIKSLLMDKQELVDLISINKVGPKLESFSIIGMTVDVKDNILEIEDNTGRLSLKIDSIQAKNLIQDEVIGIIFENDRVKRIIQPDIPFRLDTKKSQNERELMIISGIPKDTTRFFNLLNSGKKIDMILNKDSIGLEGDMSKSGHNVIVPTSPLVEIDGLKIMVISGELIEKYSAIFGYNQMDTALSLLKKRNLNPILDSTSYSNEFLLECIPDILVFTNSKNTESMNYKGMTILFNGNLDYNPSLWKLDLKTRETFKINFL